MRSDKISWSKIWNLTFCFIFTFYTDILHFSFLVLEIYILHKHFKICNFTILSFYTFYYFTTVHFIILNCTLTFIFYTDILHFTQTFYISNFYRRFTFYITDFTFYILQLTFDSDTSAHSNINQNLHFTLTFKILQFHIWIFLILHFTLTFYIAHWHFTLSTDILYFTFTTYVLHFLILYFTLFILDFTLYNLHFTFYIWYLTVDIWHWQLSTILY